MTDSNRSTIPSGKPCDCANGDECYGDYCPPNVECRNLEPEDPGIDPIGAADDDPGFEDCNVEDSYAR